MPRVTGRISAAFLEADGKTRLGDRYHAYPLKIAKAFPFDDGQLGVYMMDASPGIMSGDRYELDWHFGAHTKVYVTNQSYTKVHPQRLDETGQAVHPPSEQTQRLTLGQGAYVEYMPEPLTLYKDACFHSTTDVRMERGSTLILSEVVCPGRTQRGELFRYCRYRSRLAVRFGDEWVYCGRQQVEPGVQRLASIGAWGSFTHMGTLYVFSELADAAMAEALRIFMNGERDGFDAVARGRQDASSGLYAGISRTYKHGLIVSVMGRKAYEIQDYLERAWAFIRSRYFASAPLLVRK
ncbi:urease accessory protein UreD [Paenibacillus doosanensis]|uniref:urease accessory protein UreD n=1 Tax=Paenibacillus doosanensis TaxID=1229154 RepID=UPI00217F56E6|nr:urease accessory protein UreD [Paenibacillus doosanensis]MCS7460270.1 urease accessory protein UreD [Paenibacillus doosanensis]